MDSSCVGVWLLSTVAAAPAEARRLTSPTRIVFLMLQVVVTGQPPLLRPQLEELLVQLQPIVIATAFQERLHRGQGSQLGQD